jgi:hypothetical protein
MFTFYTPTNDPAYCVIGSAGNSEQVANVEHPLYSKTGRKTLFMNDLAERVYVPVETSLKKMEQKVNQGNCYGCSKLPAFLTVRGV